MTSELSLRIEMAVHISVFRVGAPSRIPLEYLPLASAIAN